MLGDAVVVDLDRNSLQTEYNDVESLPNSIVNDLKKKLKGIKNLKVLKNSRADSRLYRTMSSF